ncbi:phosphotransferase enzyme family protein [Phlyctema vagabunda]|uniref:Phosphotransferase enzyme family protein n=1 Tax=Phlyctema vagabunda TaxID=108571 RepID=A0ABR4PPA1_9HELO
MLDHQTQDGPYLVLSSLPSANNISFFDTAFFTSGHKCLPTPAEVRQSAGPQAKMNGLEPVSFPLMKLIVKYGPAITIAEGQCLWAIRRLCPNVPVPEVYGWCQDGGETFIYMQKVEAPTLEEEWPGLDTEERYAICTHLRHIMNELRQLRQDPANPFIGNINHEPVQDIIIEGNRFNRCFPDVPSFHDWFSGVTLPPIDPSDPDPWRPGLLDDAPIVFTHSDLHRSNILMSWGEKGMPQIAAIVDWHQSGWYPAPWEFYKARWTCKGTEQWELDFILEFLQPYHGYLPWDYFVLKRGT